MKILLLTFGSTGDVVPYVALGRGLKEHGHEVTLCTNARFEHLVKQYGLNYGHMSDEFSLLIESPQGRKILEELTSPWGFIKSIIKLIKKIDVLQQELLDDSWLAAQSQCFELIIFSPKMYWAVHFAEKLNIDSIAAPLFPQHLPTVEFPALGFPTWPIGGYYNKSTYKIVRWLSGFIGGKHIKQWRKKHDLATAFSGIDIMHDPSGKLLTVINGYSALLAPNASDWPRTVHTVGFWFLPQQSHYSPPAELLDFLAVGAKPVYIGFGSMATSDPEKTTKTIIAAVKQVGCRAIISTGWGGIDCLEGNDNIFVLEHAPHDWLFPQMAAVVHHGGAGTTAAGLKAGCPTLICPIFADQPFWGEIINQKGLGVKPIPLKKLTVQNLSSGLEQLLNSPQLKTNAEKIAKQFNQEDAVAATVDIIEGLYLSSSPQ